MCQKMYFLLLLFVGNVYSMQQLPVPEKIKKECIFLLEQVAKAKIDKKIDEQQKKMSFLSFLDSEDWRPVCSKLVQKLQEKEDKMKKFVNKNQKYKDSLQKTYVRYWNKIYQDIAYEKGLQDLDYFDDTETFFIQ